MDKKYYDDKRNSSQITKHLEEGENTPTQYWYKEENVQQLYKYKIIKETTKDF